MAFVLEGVVSDILKKLTSSTIDEFRLLRRHKADFLSLQEYFEMIQAVLEDAQHKRVISRAVDVWVSQLKSVAFMVENVLDQASTEALLQQLHKRRVKLKVKAFLSLNHNKYVNRLKISHRIQEAKQKLSEIASRRIELGLASIYSIPRHEDLDFDVGPSRETTSLLANDHSLTVGRENEMETVCETICSKDTVNYCDNGDTPVYAIWGMGGVGKTTLAQLVFDNNFVKERFDSRCWVHVGQKFICKEILKKIIEYTDDEQKSDDTDNMVILQEQLRSNLQNKRFLVVLDDVWIEDNYHEITDWESLKKTLSCGLTGSMIFTTTRSQSTCEIMAKFPELQHKLECLSEEDSWELFKKHAFARKGEIQEVESIGRQIVAKCQGLPLAVKTMGGLMCSKSTINDWKLVNDSCLWELQDKQVLPALKVSYNHLPTHAKTCFTYSCLFPKGDAFKKEDIVQLWVVNNFIPPKEEVDLFVLGRKVFECLVSRSFFQLDASCYSEIYKIHDLMHHMARLIMRDDSVFIDQPNKEVKISNQACYLSSTCSEFVIPDQDAGKLQSLRSAIMNEELNEVNISQIARLTHLKVLYLPFAIQMKTIPMSLTRLIYLKYLNLSYSSIEVVPESIMYLQNLQMLILSHCFKLCKLHKGLRYMKNLQILDISHCISLLYLPAGINELTSLRGLSMFPVGKETTRAAKVKDLGNLNQLEGSLEIFAIENVKGLEEAKTANLQSKTNLEALSLTWVDCKSDTREVTVYDDEVVLEGFEPNSCLKKLEIHHYVGKAINPTWLNKLRNLVEVVFSDFKECDRLPPLGRMPNLKIICLLSMGCLEGFHHDDASTSEDSNLMFPSLKELRVFNCKKIVFYPCNLANIKGLRVLSFFNVGKETKGAEIKELGNLNLLEGNLRITSIENVNGFQEARNANLKSKTNLSTLQLGWTKNSKTENEDDVLEGLEPNQNLKELVLLGYRGKIMSMTWIQKLRNLVEIGFYGCNMCECLPALGKLHSLRVIRLRKMKCLKFFHDDDSNMFTTNLFRSLQTIDISDCPNLVSLPWNLQEVKALLFHKCMALDSLPGNLSNIETLRLHCCDGFRSIPDEIKNFKHLNFIGIWECKYLSERCEKEIGEDWSKISHITNISVVRKFHNKDENEDREDETVIEKMAMKIEQMKMKMERMKMKMRLQNDG